MQKCRFIPLVILMLIFLTGCDEAPLDGNTGGENPSFTVYFTDNGLSDNWITDIAVDHIRGGVWFATKNGLSFYSNIDSSFTTYGAETVIPDMEMNSVMVDITGSVWVGTVSGAAYLPVSDSLFHVLPDRDNLINRYVTDILYTFTNNGTRWFGTSGGISTVGMSGWLSYTTQLGQSYNITTLTVGPDNKIWAGSKNGVAVFNGLVWDTGYSTHLPSQYVNTMYIDNAGTVWIGTNSIATAWDGVAWTNYGPADGLPATGFTSFNHDTDGVFWAGTNSGLYFRELYTWNQLELPSNADTAITALEWDISSGSLWIGTQTGVVQYVGND